MSHFRHSVGRAITANVVWGRRWRWCLIGRAEGRKRRCSQFPIFSQLDHGSRDRGRYLEPLFVLFDKRASFHSLAISVILPIHSLFERARAGFQSLEATIVAPQFEQYSHSFQLPPPPTTVLPHTLCLCLSLSQLSHHPSFPSPRLLSFSHFRYAPFRFTEWLGDAVRSRVAAPPPLVFCSRALFSSLSLLLSL